MLYETIYAFSVADRLEKKEEVYCVDRERQIVKEVADMQVDDFFDLINKAKKDANRYEFYVRKEQ